MAVNFSTTEQTGLNVKVRTVCREIKQETDQCAHFQGRDKRLEVLPLGNVAAEQVPELRSPR